MMCPAGRADTLLYNNGDRVQGAFVAWEAGQIIFDSVHFGRLRVPSDEASVDTQIREQPGPIGDLGERPHPPPAAADVDNRRTRTSWLAPWKGQVNLALDLSDDSRAHGVLMLEGRLQRNWTRDELRLETRYDYREDDFETSTDLLKGTLRWRRDVSASYFTVCRSMAEWNRHSTYAGRSASYVLLQQELGVGWKVVDRRERSISVGLAENLFKLWIEDAGGTLTRNTESAFLEVETVLPWGTHLRGRGVLYYAGGRGGNGWENSLELTRRLNEAVTVGLRHESRYNLPNVRVDDRRKLRLTVGYEF